MADPLSVTASVIAVITLSAKVIKDLRKLRGLREADDLLHALMNEVTTVRSISCQIEAVVRQHRGSPSSEQLLCLESLEDLLRATNAKLEELNIIIHYRLLRPSSKIDGSEKLSRKAWLRHKGEIQKLQQELRTLKQNIGMLVETLNLSHSFQTSCRVEGLSIGMQNMDRDYHLHQQNTSQALTAVSEMANRTLGQLEDMQNYVRDTARKIQDAQANVNPSEARGSAITEAPAEATQNTTVEVHLEQVQQEPCAEICSCICHKPGRFGITFLDRVIGSLFVGYAGLPVITRPCNEHLCRKKKHRSKISAHFTFYFPSWFLSRMIYSAVEYTPRDGPQILFIRSPRIRPLSAPIFRFVMCGDIEAVKRAFENGDASPYDVLDEGQSSLLHIALYNEHLEMCRLLIENKSDYYLKSSYGISPYDLAWDKVLALPDTYSHYKNDLHALFEDTDHLDERQFSPLHRILLGLNSGNLEQQLKLSTSLIDQVDSKGKTALYWAVTRGELDNVQILLRYGADPNICSSTQGNSPLHAAYHSINSAACVEVLLANGAHVNKLNVYGHSPLHIATQSSLFGSVELLLRKGADKDGQDCNGWTALHYSIADNRPKSLQVLVKSKPNYQLKTKRGETILHFAASDGDIQILKILTKARMKGLPLKATDSIYQRTAEETANSFHPKEPSEWWNAFYALLESVDDKQGSDGSSTTGDELYEQTENFEHTTPDDEDDASFEDAVEEL